MIIFNKIILKFKNIFIKFFNFFKRLFSNKVTYNQNSFKLRSDNWITRYRFDTFANKEPETLKWIDKNFIKNDVFFDIGANIGIYSLYAASKNIPNSNIYSFEPEFSNLNELKFNVINNNFNKIINMFSFAFGDGNHISYLNINDVTPGAALHTLDNNKSSESKIKEGVYVISIDNFCKDQSVYPNLVKVDIDGNEDKFLSGAQDLLKNIKLRSVLIELDEMEIRDKCIKLFEVNGFKLKNYYKKNSIFEFSRL
jgi:FkbM family methyltransferase